MQNQPLFPQVIDRIPVESVDPALSEVIAVAEGYRLENLERYRLSPNRFRAAFTTRWINEWASYVAEHGDRYNTAIFINPEQPQATAILDYGDDARRPHNLTAPPEPSTTDPSATQAATVRTQWLEPEWGQHTASVKLQATPVWKALIGLNGQTLAPDILADLLLDHPTELHALNQDPGLSGLTDLPDSADPDNAAVMSLETAVHQLRHTSTHKSRDAEHSNEHLSQSRSIAERAILTSSPPTGLLLRASAYERLPPITASARIRYDLSGDKPLLSLRLYRLAQIEHQITGQFAAEITRALDALDAPRITYTGTHTNRNTER